ncbi:unnamed protein product [Ranitomeya imitator]|uniref:Protein FAM167A n=1 Tax=Ranitomeya imitator TaxID=111125 RepID=A0ABN9LJS3_9NEOB|nr:unnamed protein product [Ranitomeya imitator]
MSLPKIQIEEPEDEAEGNSDAPTDDHLRILKALTEKLRLETRRPSYLEWRARLEDQPWKSPNPPLEQEVEEQKQTEGEISSTLEMEQVQKTMSVPKESNMLASGKIHGFDSIDEALVWLRKELGNLLPSPPGLTINSHNSQFTGKITAGEFTAECLYRELQENLQQNVCLYGELQENLQKNVYLYGELQENLQQNDCLYGEMQENLQQNVCLYEELQ